MLSIIRYRKDGFIIDSLKAFHDNIITNEHVMNIFVCNDKSQLKHWFSLYNVW